MESLENLFEGGAVKKVKKEETPEPTVESVSAWRFFSILQGCDRVLLVIAFIACFCNGLVYPSVGWVLGEVTGAYDPANGDQTDEVMSKLLKNIFLVGGYLWITGYVYYSLF